jgi:hypothetical protein
LGMVAPEQQIASAFFVLHGNYGDVTRYAQERGVCRQWIYREAAALRKALANAQQQIDRLHEQLRQTHEQRTALETRLAQAVVLDAQKQEQVACVAQARGVTLRDCRELLEVLRPGQTLSVAELGRRTQAAGKKAGELLVVLDEVARQKVHEAAADEIYVKDPVLMVVEPESLCWLSGRLTDAVSGEAWAREFAQLPNLEQVMRDGGSGLAKGVALVKAQRQEQAQPQEQVQRPLTDQGDHFHALRPGGVGLNKAKRQARKALAAAETAQKRVDECARQGQSRTGAATRARHAWQQAEQAMDTWQEREQLWEKTKQALHLFTPDGALNTRAQAEAVLAETLPQLPDSDFAKAKRQLQQPEMLNYLDRVQDKLAALPFAEEVKQAAVHQEGLRRRPEALQGETTKAAALRGVLLLCAVVLSKAGDEGLQAAAAVQDLFRRAYRASSLVECINSVLRMHQAGHRRMTQGLLDLKRLYWNCHPFGAGRRRKTTPYERLGVPWPPGLRWWEVLKLTPEQLRDKLSTTTMAV